MTTEPFPPSPSADPADGTAAFAPVTAEAMDHVAHEAAERADAVAREAPETVPGTRDDESEPEPAAADPASARDADHAPALREGAPAANENTAVPGSETVATAPLGALRAADLAFTHGTPGTDRLAETASRSADSLGRYNAKILEIATENMSAAGDLVSALLGAASIAEATAINADHVRRRLDALTMQGRELLLLGQKVAFDALRSAGEGSRKP